MELITSPQAWLAFAMLTALELVLGIDNLILIAIMVDELPAHQRVFARKVGLVLAMVNTGMARAGSSLTTINGHPANAGCAARRDGASRSSANDRAPTTRQRPNTPPGRFSKPRPSAPEFDYDRHDLPSSVRNSVLLVSSVLRPAARMSVMVVCVVTTSPADRKSVV